MSTRAEGSPLWIVTHPKGLLARAGSPLLDEHDVAALGLGPTLGHPVGDHAGRAVRVYAIAGRELPEGLDPIGLRALHGSVAEDVLATAIRAVQVATFVETHRFCGRCATPTVPVPGERCLRCPACALDAYPRLSPVVIVLVRRGPEALLARHARYPGAFYSTLAGFVEIGETLEQALAREVREEVGIEIGAVRYFGSQPWPFPHQLMVGFTAEHRGGEVRADGEEIADARWFRPDALPEIPPRFSIARRMIDAWIDETTAR